jgi:hypothetical protein
LGLSAETLAKEGAVAGFFVNSSLVVDGKVFVTSEVDGSFRDANVGGVWLVFTFGVMSEKCSSPVGVT